MPFLAGMAVGAAVVALAVTALFGYAVLDTINIFETE